MNRSHTITQNKGNIFNDYLIKWNNSRKKLPAYKAEKEMLTMIKEDNVESFLCSILSIERKIRILSRVNSSNNIDYSIYKFILEMNNNKFDQQNQQMNEFFLILFKEEEIIKRNEMKNQQIKFEKIIFPKKKELNYKEKNRKLKKKLLNLEEKFEETENRYKELLFKTFEKEYVKIKSNYSTSLHFAAQNDSPKEIGELIISKGININSKDGY